MQGYRVQYSLGSATSFKRKRDADFEAVRRCMCVCVRVEQGPNPEEDLGIRLVLNRFGLGLPSGFTTFYTAPEGYYQTTRVGQG